ncbi:NPCBM/NEW2 domain-containing protein [Curtobacterium sp. PhB136]|uniref:NPCBM/NEW2 domain-containing protein n=1 Tax=Curtobacterium sp. PhB136 TaxID=2485181 RepID=UPI00104D8B4E|nr:NPCBM/NEW2 domain-containing protein [Curtobacterium sp. PhB136]TCK65775.1 NPCBM/NEW2 domain-containing protein [Curtobacterium sp. PhB136]
MPNTTSNPPPGSRWKTVAVWCGGVLTALLVTYITYIAGWNGTPSDSSENSATRSSAHSAPSTSGPRASEPSEGTQAPSPQPAVQYLASLAPIDTSTDVDPAEIVPIGGTTYPHSVQYSCFTFCNDPNGVIEYNLGKKFTRFTVTVGGDDNAEAAAGTGYFAVYLDGTLATQVSVNNGEPKEISVPVTGVLRLRLEVGGSKTPDSPMQAGVNAAGGLSETLPDLVWGSPKLYTG